MTVVSLHFGFRHLHFGKVWKDFLNSKRLNESWKGGKGKKREYFPRIKVSIGLHCVVFPVRRMSGP